MAKLGPITDFTAYIYIYIDLSLSLYLSLSLPLSPPLAFSLSLSLSISFSLSRHAGDVDWMLEDTERDKKQKKLGTIQLNPTPKTPPQHQRKLKTPKQSHSWCVKTLQVVREVGIWELSVYVGSVCEWGLGVFFWGGCGLFGSLWGGGRQKLCLTLLGTRHWAQGVDKSADKSTFVNTLGGHWGSKKSPQTEGVNKNVNKTLLLTPHLGGQKAPK